MATQPVTGEAKIYKLDASNTDNKQEKDYKEPKDNINH